MMTWRSVCFISDTDWPGFGGSEPKYQTRKAQADAFASAVNGVGIAPQQESEEEEPA